MVVKIPDHIGDACGVSFEISQFFSLARARSGAEIANRARIRPDQLQRVSSAPRHSRCGPNVSPDAIDRFF